MILEISSPTCEVVHETKESSLQKSPTDSSLAQLAEHETCDPEVVSSNPTGGNFLTKFILFHVTLDLSDNLTEMRIVKNSIVIVQLYYLGQNNVGNVHRRAYTHELKRVGSSCACKSLVMSDSVTRQDNFSKTSNPTLGIYELFKHLADFGNQIIQTEWT